MPATVIKGENMMLLRFRITYIAYSILVSIALVVVQMVTPMAHAQDPESDRTADPACPTVGVDKMRDIKALSCVLATVATQLGKKEEKLTDLKKESGIHAEFNRREPLMLSIKDLCTVQKELKQLALGQRRIGGRVIANLDHFLIRAHVKYKDLKVSCKNLEKKSCPDNVIQYCQHLHDIDVNIHALLTRRGLHRTMSAVVRGGANFADVANDRMVLSGKPSAQLPPSVNVLLGTKHWRDEEWPV